MSSRETFTLKRVCLLCILKLKAVLEEVTGPGDLK